MLRSRAFSAGNDFPKFDFLKPIRKPLRLLTAQLLSRESEPAGFQNPGDEAGQKNDLAPQHC